MYNWLPIAAALAGVLLAGIISYLNNATRFYQDRRWQTELQLRAKLEEISSLCDENYWRYAKSARSVVEYVESRRDSPEVDLPSLGRLNTLISFYSPDLKPQLALIEEVRNFLEEAIIEASHARGAEKSRRQEVNSKLAQADVRMYRACGSMAAATASLVYAEVSRSIRRKRND